MSGKPYVLDLDRGSWDALLRGWGEPAYRASQVWRHLHVLLTENPEQMTDLPVALRRKLATELRWQGLRLERVVTCDRDLTRKALLRLDDGSPAEAVLMVYPDRATVCVSSQSGCPMACVFCATGKLGFLHDLSTGEIVEQVLWAERELRRMAEAGGRDDVFPLRTRVAVNTHRLTNVVFMGMGEPFNNYDRWWAAVERLHDPQGFNLGSRSFTVSTVGLVPGILRLAEEPLPVNLAISLHAPNDKLRESLMPVNKSYPLDALLQATRHYIAKTNRRVSFEYVLLEKVNDLPGHAEELAVLLGGGRDGGTPLLCHVNLIPWNPVPGTPLQRSQRERVLAFQSILQERKVACTVRVERGTEIAAACGQLAGSTV